MDEKRLRERIFNILSSGADLRAGYMPKRCPKKYEKQCMKKSMKKPMKKSKQKKNISPARMKKLQEGRKKYLAKYKKLRNQGMSPADARQYLKEQKKGAGYHGYGSQVGGYYEGYGSQVGGYYEGMED